MRLRRFFIIHNVNVHNVAWNKIHCIREVLLHNVWMLAYNVYDRRSFLTK